MYIALFVLAGVLIGGVISFVRARNWLFALLVLAGLLIGGVYSFARHRQWLAAVIALAAAGLAFAGAMLWVPR